MKYQKIYCCGCQDTVDARLTDGKEIYSLRQDLWKLPFWVCPRCGHYVGCHHKTSDPTKPLGVIPSGAIRELRKQIHRTLDPLWRSGKMTRSEAYRYVSEKLGYEYHTAEIRSEQEGKQVLSIVQALALIVD